MLKIDLKSLPAALHLGTSSFSSKDWVGPFYPPGTKPGDYLSFYAQTFGSVEIDATWHAMPAARTVEAWAHKVPPEFVFSLKVPKTITHDAYLADCQDEWTRFLKLLDPLEGKRGPLLFQFPYVAKGKDAHEYATGEDFRRRLSAFLPQIPDEGQFVVEIRNEKWLDDKLMDLLRSRGIALALIAYFTMPGPARLGSMIDPVTAPFSYVRFLGHHRKMDALIKQAQKGSGKQGAWNELLVDRAKETRAWADLIRELLDRPMDVFAYFNNHFAGFAPGSADLFCKIWREATGESQHELPLSE